jgi:hypothetical protein
MRIRKMPKERATAAWNDHHTQAAARSAVAAFPSPFTRRPSKPDKGIRFYFGAARGKGVPEEKVVEGT